MNERTHDSLTRCRGRHCFKTISVHCWGFMRDELFPVGAYLSLFELDRKYSTLAAALILSFN